MLVSTNVNGTKEYFLTNQKYQFLIKVVYEYKKDKIYSVTNCRFCGANEIIERTFCCAYCGKSYLSIY